MFGMTETGEWNETLNFWLALLSLDTNTCGLKTTGKLLGKQQGMKQRLQNDIKNSS